MSTELLASKIVIIEEPPKVISVPALPTAVLALVGVAQRGPMNTPTLVTSFEEYTRYFGTYTTDADMTLSAQLFFAEGGKFLYANRITHYTDITSAATKQSAAATLMLQTAATAPTKGSVTGTATETFSMTPGMTLDCSVDGGATDTATIDAAAASLECANAETYDLFDGATLTVKIDGEAVAQTITFDTAEFADITNATAEEVAAVINAEIIGASASASSTATKVTITSDTFGTDSEVEVTGGTGNTGGVNRLGFSTSPVSGTGDVADITAVTVAELKTVIEADVTGVTVTSVSGKVKVETDTIGASGSIQIEATSTADTVLGLDNATHSGSSGAAQDTLKVDGKYDGSYANVYTITIGAATSGETGHYNLTVEEAGEIIEIFSNVQSTDSTAADFVETVVNNADTGSLLIAVTDQGIALNPAAGSFGPMTSGDDGLTSLDDNDYIGSSVSGLGIRAFDTVSGITLLAIPGQATTAVQSAMIQYAEITRNRSIFCVLDPPAGNTAAQIITYVEGGGAPLLGSSEHAAMYWPRIKILNPNKTVFGSDDQITVAASGALAGMYARTDAATENGIHQPPAGVERGILFSALDLETDEAKDERKLDLVYPKRINPITLGNGQRSYADGTRTLKATGSFPTIAERRGASQIEQAIKGLLEFARHSNNTPDLRATVERVAFAYLLGKTRISAFASNDPAKAFQVDFGEGLNPPSMQFQGKLVGRIGLAFAKPTDWVILKFTQDMRALEAELQAAGL